MSTSRRRFLAEVGQGMLLASVGSSIAADLGISRAMASEEPNRLLFGPLEPLVRLMQESSPEKLLPEVVSRLRNGTSLKQIVSAAALANARTFGGEDYIGFHTMMALAPAYQMAQELPVERAALPVLKVLHRNSNRIQEKEPHGKEVLQALPGERVSGATYSSDALRNAVQARDLKKAETIFAGLATTPETALNELLPEVHESVEVHRVVMVSRSWDLLDLVGKEHAHTLLRQSVHYCVNAENDNQKKYFAEVRALLPKLMDQYSFTKRSPGTKPADDGWVNHLAETIFRSTPTEAAKAAAEALAEGFVPSAVGEAICLAANQLVLRDIGRTKDQAQKNKPEGSVHGDSIGVHASDSANAWRNLAKVANTSNAFACLILGAYQVALDRSSRGGDFLKWQPYPLGEHLEKVAKLSTEKLLPELEESIRQNQQATAAALVHRMGELKQAPRAIFDLLLKYAISEDGALHAEKYYRTVAEEFELARMPFKWRQLTALARVTASEYGTQAAGYKQACELLRVS